MARSGSPTDDDRDGGGSERAGGDARSGDPVTWFAESTIRIVLALVGVVVVLFAVGMATGVDVLGAVTDLLSSSIGRWLVVAVIGLAIVTVALDGFGRGE